MMIGCFEDLHLEEVGIESGGFGTQTLAGPIKGLYGNGITSSLRLGVAYDSETIDSFHR